MSDWRLPPKERPSSEPEIIPPDRGRRLKREDAFLARGIVEESGTRRIYVARVGPFGLLPFVLLGGVFAIVLLVFLFGALLILIPVAGLALAAALIASWLRGPSRWLR